MTLIVNLGRRYQREGRLATDAREAKESVEITAQAAAAVGMLQTSQRALLDAADGVARQAQSAAHFGPRTRGAVEAVAQGNDDLFARSESGQQFADDGAQFTGIELVFNVSSIRSTAPRGGCSGACVVRQSHIAIPAPVMPGIVG